ncbi:MAG TPA: sugar ABC transporter substrate-binding protein [Gaiellaceae bacterium]|nr:sugar ABC transporter substrate-binding protein [Gaiellaceae bacterium]
MKGHRPVAFGALVAVLATTAGIAAATSSGSQRQKTFTLAYVPPVIANPIIKAGNDAMSIQAKSLGMKFSTVGGEYNPQAQIVAVNAVLQRKFDALAIWPLDPKGIKPSLAKAKSAGLPVFVQDSPSSVPPANINFALDDYDATFKLAKYAAAQIKKGGKSCKVGIVQGLPFIEILNNRNKGLEAGAKAAGCEVLAKQVNTKDNTDGAKPIVDAWKTKYGSDMTGVLAYNDPSALAAVADLGGGFDPLITGVNGDSLAIGALKRGDMLATASQPAIEFGATIAWSANQVLNGKKLPSTIWNYHGFVTRDNVSKYVTLENRLKQGPWNVRIVKQKGRSVAVVTPK